MPAAMGQRPKTLILLSVVDGGLTRLAITRAYVEPVKVAPEPDLPTREPEADWVKGIHRKP
jgi:hypothetical protein